MENSCKIDTEASLISRSFEPLIGFLISNNDIPYMSSKKNPNFQRVTLKVDK